MIIWITGLSGSGKSTLARALQLVFKQKDQMAVVLDGDQVREIIADPHTGHDHESRLRNAFRIARLAQLLSAQDCLVIVATMSLFHEIHQWNRENTTDYFEVLLEVERAVLRQRDAKGLYAQFERGQQKNIPGFDLPVEWPIRPDLVLANQGDLSPEEQAQRIYANWLDRKQT